MTGPCTARRAAAAVAAIPIGAFSTDADFSGMTAEGQLYIGEVVQKAFIESNETGTEATAATGVVMEDTAMVKVEPPPVVFHADHPFLYLMRDRDTGAVLFLGRIVDPR